MTQAYEQGFITKCAEYGVNPEALIKQAQMFTTPYLDHPTAIQPAIEAGKSVIDTLGRVPGKAVRAGNRIGAKVRRGVESQLWPYRRIANAGKTAAKGVGDTLDATGRFLGRAWRAAKRGVRQYGQDILKGNVPTPRYGSYSSQPFDPMAIYDPAAPLLAGAQPYGGW